MRPLPPSNIVVGQRGKKCCSNRGTTSLKVITPVKPSKINYWRANEYLPDLLRKKATACNPKECGILDTSQIIQPKLSLHSNSFNFNRSCFVSLKKNGRSITRGCSWLSTHSSNCSLRDPMPTMIGLPVKGSSPWGDDGRPAWWDIQVWTKHQCRLLYLEECSIPF